jgi:hypothetical protein
MLNCATFEPIDGDWYLRYKKTMCLDAVECQEAADAAGRVGRRRVNVPASGTKAKPRESGLFIGPELSG